MRERKTIVSGSTTVLPASGADASGTAPSTAPASPSLPPSPSAVPAERGFYSGSEAENESASGVTFGPGGTELPVDRRRASAPPENGVERRRSSVDRRAGIDRRVVDVGSPTGLERRRGPGRRRSENRRSAEEGEMTDEQFEFVLAIDTYKRLNSRPFPTWTEVLEVIKQMGYRKVAQSSLVLPGTRGAMGAGGGAAGATINGSASAAVPVIAPPAVPPSASANGLPPSEFFPG